MNAPQWLATALLLNALGGYCAPPAHAQSAGDKEIMRAASDSYDNLAKDGLMEFKCEVVPDWDGLLKSIKAIQPDAGTADEILPYLKQTHFKVSVGPKGAATVSHESDAVAPSVQLAERITRSTSGADQTITGFFQAWGGIAMDSMLPETDSYKLENLGDHYRLTYKEGPSDIVALIAMDYTQTEITITTPQIIIVLHPKFSRAKKGFMLTDLDGLYKTPSNAQMAVKIHVDYGQVEDFDLPSSAVMTMPVGDKTVDMQLAFTAYQIKKR
jgi:hypothetical protein